MNSESSFFGHVQPQMTLEHCKSKPSSLQGRRTRRRSRGSQGSWRTCLCRRELDESTWAVWKHLSHWGERAEMHQDWKVQLKCYIQGSEPGKLLLKNKKTRNLQSSFIIHGGLRAVNFPPIRKRLWKIHFMPVFSSKSLDWTVTKQETWPREWGIAWDPRASWHPQDSASDLFLTWNLGPWPLLDREDFFLIVPVPGGWKADTTHVVTFIDTKKMALRPR